MKKRNPVAKDLRTPKYKQRTIKPKKGKGSYSRSKEWIKERFGERSLSK